MAEKKMCHCNPHDRPHVWKSPGQWCPADPVWPWTKGDE